MKLTVYSKNDCMQCMMIKKQLKAKAVEFEEINLDEQPEFIDHVKGLGYTAAPVVEYGDYTFAGFNPNKVREVINMVSQ